ncbi:DUF6134 family protein [Chitinophaga japonensis]|nr:DUF6134 family protein [Chitinophaga japonensis]
MQSLIRLGAFIGWCMLMAAQLPAQVHHFEIRLGSRVIGVIDARSNTSGAARHMLIRSRIETRLLSKFTDISCEYNNNVLTQSRVLRSNGGKDGDGKEVTTRREGARYLVNLEGEQSTLQTAEIRHSVSDLYFTEPRQITRIYSETLGRFLSLKALGNGAYELLLPEGKKNIYRYRKGALVEVEVNHALGKAHIVKKS